jgi:hypothetical protein
MIGKTRKVSKTNASGETISQPVSAEFSRNLFIILRVTRKPNLMA